MVQTLVQQLKTGDRKALARLITLIENGSPEGEEALELLPPVKQPAHIIGVTGPAGVGKSCLISHIVAEFRRRGKTVAVIAVDPNSPLTGGAVLGDRLRMQEHFSDSGVFIRSMGARENPGGIPKTLGEILKVLNASGRDIIIIETVGAGQSETEIAKAAYTVLVVVMPGMGDEIQTLKAGILEIGDVFAVNKADLPDSDRAVQLLESMLEDYAQREYRPPIVKTVATTGEGTAELVDSLYDHWSYLNHSGMLRAKLRQNAEREILKLAAEALQEKLRTNMKEGEMSSLLEKVAAGEIPVRTATRKLMTAVFKDG
ncbi:MAG: methylmalonyl Co-A mutase-associated GTPase MeaB [Candidatus Bathyarchaeia archaeon]